MALRSSPAALLPSDRAGHLVPEAGVAGTPGQPREEGEGDPASSRGAEAEEKWFRPPLAGMFHPASPAGPVTTALENLNENQM